MRAGESTQNCNQFQASPGFHFLLGSPKCLPGICFLSQPGVCGESRSGLLWLTHFQTLLVKLMYGPLLTLMGTTTLGQQSRGLSPPVSPQCFTICWQNYGILHPPPSSSVEYLLYPCSGSKAAGFHCWPQTGNPRVLHNELDMSQGIGQQHPQARKPKTLPIITQSSNSFSQINVSQFVDYLQFISSTLKLLFLTISYSFIFTFMQRENCQSFTLLLCEIY